MAVGLTHDQIIQKGFDENNLPSGYYRSDGAGAGMGGIGGNFSDMYKQAIQISQQSAQPAIDNLKSSIQPLQDRYKTLLDSVKGNVGAEFGKRGIPLSSGIYNDAVTQAQKPIYQQQESDIGNINNKIADLQSGGNAAGNALQLLGLQQSAQQSQAQLENAYKIAQLQSGGGDSPGLQFASVGGGGYIYNPQTGQVVNTLRALTGSGGGWSL